MNGENESCDDKGIPDALWAMMICVVLVVLPLLAIATESDTIIYSVSILVVISIALTIYFTKPRKG